MLSKTQALLRAAQSRQYAIGGFNVYNLEGVNAVIAAAEACDSPVLLQVHPGALAHGGNGLIALCMAAAGESTVPVGVHLDHCSDQSVIEDTLAIGIPSVMADGSHLTYPENVAFVKQAVTLSHQHQAVVEGELGRISGTEDGLTVEAIDARMTDPQQALDFVQQTGLDALAVCIGNIHGKYPFPPKLDFDRLQAIRQAVDVPLVLHGASGLGDDLIQRSIELGICKFNVNTEVRTAFLQSLRDETTANPTIDLVPLMEAAQRAMQAVIMEKLKLFGSVGKAAQS